MFRFYKTKPLTVSAVCWNGANFDEIASFIAPLHLIAIDGVQRLDSIGILTRAGLIVVRRGDWVIKDFFRNFHCVAEIEFNKTYELEV